MKWIPRGTRAAFEFRNASWLTGEVYNRLEEKDLALCIADSEKTTTPVVATAGYGYFRLRDEGYGQEDIRAWSDKIKEHQGVWGDVFVYFKHEEEGKGPGVCQGAHGEPGYIRLAADAQRLRKEARLHAHPRAGGLERPRA